MSKSRFLEGTVPLALLGALGCMILPLPPYVLDLLLATNLALAVLLFAGALTVREPLGVAAFPAMLLLTTLFRLALNIATTRAILSTGHAGSLVMAFGSVVMGGSIVVGCVLFALITVVQFVVVAKGAERVAEVAARFTLDALPGKQISIDADIRAGLIDPSSAKKKREDLQTESRFYGALDGAMKFVKGDAIAGIIIVLVNIIGGLVIGITIQGLEPMAAVKRFSVLSIGDALLAQLPSLMNAVAAGLVVTRVVRSDGYSLVREMAHELLELRDARLIGGGVALALACAPGMPMIPLILVGGLLLLSLLIPQAQKAEVAIAPAATVIRLPSSISIEFSSGLVKRITGVSEVNALGEMVRARMYDKFGLVLSVPEFSVGVGEQSCVRVSFRGVLAREIGIQSSGIQALHEIVNVLEELVGARAEEFVDDIMTRRALDFVEREAPDLVAHVVPGVSSVTQITSILRGLIRENVPIRHLDLILQTISECHGRGNDRLLLTDTRVALKRLISQSVAQEGIVRGYVLEPVVDLALVKAEENISFASQSVHNAIFEFVDQHDFEEGATLVASKRARMYLADLLRSRGIKVTVLAHEELTDDVQFECLGYLSLEGDSEREKVVEQLVA